MKTAQRIRRLNGITGILCAALMLSASQTHANPVSMKLDDLGRGMYRLEGHIQVKSTRKIAWGVLSDYDRIHTFVSSLRRSEVKEASNGFVYLEQEAQGKVLFFSRTIRVKLKVVEKPFSCIAFEDVSGKDFTYYAGFWELRETTQGTEIIYRLDCQRRFLAPNFIARDAIRKSAEELLADVQEEILRRSRTNTSI